MKSKVKLGLARMPVPAKIEKGRQIVIHLTGNTSFTTPVPSLAAVTTAINNLETAYNAAQDGGRPQRAHLADMEEAFDLVLTQLALYVELTAAGSETKILSAGMDTKRAASLPGSVGIPGGIKVLNVAPGEVKLLWKPVKGAATYLVQKCLAPGTASRDSLQWELAGYSTKARLVVTGLEIGGVYSFRIAAIGAEGQGAWSDIATRPQV